MTIRLGNFLIELRLSFLLIFILLIALFGLRQSFLLIGAVTIHELAHISAARAFGLRTRGIVVMPMGQMAVIDGMEYLLIWKRLLIVSAGVLINLFICLISDGLVYQLNMSIALVNLLPVYPLDGGRAIFYILGEVLPINKARKIILVINKTLAFVLFLLGLIQLYYYPFNFSLILIAFYIFECLI